MPQKYTKATLPKPENANVQVGDLSELHIVPLRDFLLRFLCLPGSQRTSYGSLLHGSLLTSVMASAFSGSGDVLWRMAAHPCWHPPEEKRISDDAPSVSDGVSRACRPQLPNI